MLFNTFRLTKPLNLYEFLFVRLFGSCRRIKKKYSLNIELDFNYTRRTRHEVELTLVRVMVCPRGPRLLRINLELFLIKDHCSSAEAWREGTQH